MSRAEAARAAAEVRVKSCLANDWRTAKQVADRLGMPWRVVARVLKQMAMRGDIQTEESEMIAKRCRIRVRPVYRLNPYKVSPNSMPMWLRCAAGFLHDGGV